jgi:NAD(P)H-hydrate epimerase
LGIPGAVLMRRAARHIADACLELADDEPRAVAVFCGAGNNGGDGIGAAAELLRAGVLTRVFLIGDPARLTPDSLEMARRLEEYGGVLEGFDEAVADAYLRRCDVIIDAIFGTGLSRPIEGDALAATRLINASGVRVVSADIPTGINADTGEILGGDEADAVFSNITVTFTTAKPGHFLPPGSVYSGELRVRGIGIPRESVDSTPCTVSAVVTGDIILPRRAPDTHKYDYGDVLIIAGSLGYTGAPVLAARAASCSGAGLVRLGVPDEIYSVAASKCSGEVVFPISVDPDFGVGIWDVISARAEKSDAILIGPGLGNTPSTLLLVKNALEKSDKPVILDADGINALSGNTDILDNAACPVILTPHDGEFLRLTGTGGFSGGRLTAARSFACSRGCILILKGHRTITALPDGSAYINTTGSPALAKGGSGDVLSGVLAALIGQGFPIKDACLAAVYLHGLAGEIAAGRLGEYSVTPDDIIGALPQAFLSAAE